MREEKVWSIITIVSILIGTLSLAAIIVGSIPYYSTVEEPRIYSEDYTSMVMPSGVLQAEFNYSKSIYLTQGYYLLDVIFGGYTYNIKVTVIIGEKQVHTFIFIRNNDTYGRHEDYIIFRIPEATNMTIIAKGTIKGPAGGISSLKYTIKRSNSVEPIIKRVVIETSIFALLTAITIIAMAYIALKFREKYAEPKIRTGNTTNIGRPLKYVVFKGFEIHGYMYLIGLITVLGIVLLGRPTMKTVGDPAYQVKSTTLSVVQTTYGFMVIGIIVLWALAILLSWTKVSMDLEGNQLLIQVKTPISTTTYSYDIEQNQVVCVEDKCELVGISAKAPDNRWVSLVSFTKEKPLEVCIKIPLTVDTREIKIREKQRKQMQ